jgi:hypothetical protein
LVGEALVGEALLVRDGFALLALFSVSVSIVCHRSCLLAVGGDEWKAV